MVKISLYTCSASCPLERFGVRPTSRVRGESQRGHAHSEATSTNSSLDLEAPSLFYIQSVARATIVTLMVTITFSKITKTPLFVVFRHLKRLKQEKQRNFIFSLIPNHTNRKP